jgi:hypothetical protein
MSDDDLDPDAAPDPAPDDDPGLSDAPDGDDESPVQDPADLLRRASLDGGKEARLEETEETSDEPDLWADGLSVRELRLLARVGAAAACVIPALYYFAGNGYDQHPDLMLLMLLLGGVAFFGTAAVLVIGVMPTLRRRDRLMLVLGLVLTPYVYALWAAVLLARLRNDGLLASADA